MMGAYTIVDVSAWPRTRDEQMGSKEKFWCRAPSSERFWLFKFSRPGTGEDWAEKLAAEIAQLLGLPHATIELAVCNGRRGSLACDFVGDRSQKSLIHGNELMLEIDPTYPSAQTYRLAHHTLDRVFEVLQRDFIHLPGGVTFPPGVETAADLFAGYLMLDALIGNTDRHHQNWGVIERQSATREERFAELAPTFDHASSLGRELTDEARRERLQGKPPAPSVQTYFAKARSAIYASPTDKRPLSPLDAFRLAARRRQKAAEAWVQQLSEIAGTAFAQFVQAVPESRMSDAARKFTNELLQLSRSHLLEAISCR